jgi:hypothetical protein
MFSVDEITAQAIRQVIEESGELSAMIELRRHFPGITDNAAARRCARMRPCCMEAHGERKTSKPA